MSEVRADYHAFAISKLVAVLGAHKAATAMAEALRACALERIETADDLHSLSQALVRTGGFAGAVGGLLGVHAVIHGARVRDSSEARL